MRKILSLCICAAFVLGLVACGQKSGGAEPATLGTKFQKDFEEGIDASEDIMTIADKLVNAEYNTYDCIDRKSVV